MDMEKLIQALKEKEKKYKAGGGKEKVVAQHNRGKLTARERIDLFLDPGSFVEIGLFAEQRAKNFGLTEPLPGDGVVTGYGTVNGRRVVVAAQDFTVQGGSVGSMHADKICRAIKMAQEMGVPFISLNDSGGARIQEGIEALEGYSKIFAHNIDASGIIPQISVIGGPCAGGAVYSPALTDFIVMIKGSNMFITGPQVIKEVTGEEVDGESLGGALIHNQISGVAHFYAESEQEAVKIVKELLSYLPANYLESPPVAAEEGYRRVLELNSLIPVQPTKVYDVREVIKAIADFGRFFEVQALFAPNIVIGFIRIGGETVGVIANQPKVKAGCLDIDASNKASRFIRFCDAFNIPLLTLEDIPGYLPGVWQEHAGIIRHGAKVLYAYGEATVPKITVILRKAYGGGYIAMCSKNLGADLTIALPTADIGVVGADAAVNILYRDEIKNAENPEDFRQEKISEFIELFGNPYYAASKGIVDIIVEPAELRNQILAGFKFLKSKKIKKSPKKHGNIPL
ncbi:methylmalonyl-CoA carboxyltransferase [Carboxydothermus islandicus]|uniref:Methylmalonyl-CoA carboxyltransferase n=1 Tax=Carboxydothermus islandicus TaxID=661089 RepID=A0A1L8D3E8_9THEO|nr:acyl-CoA carboxylase subunit beta [Carboxydothermus islandicus]GAV25689.1 methylmalonyl-CoA carboxyltransferase [Carboxydothermus islandicus]